MSASFERITIHMGRPSRHFLYRFFRSEDGSMTMWGLFIFLSIAILSGLAIDISRLQTRTVQMQNAADSAAHAALMARRTSSASTATERAIAIAQGHMPSSLYGTVLTPTDVQFGRWDTTTRTFTADPSRTNAVRVTIRQTAASGNPFRTSLLRLVGITRWDAVRTAVFRNNALACQRQGIIAQGAMRFYSDSSFYAPICMHSNTSFQLDTGNTFETGVGVSVPSSSNVIQPSSNSNPGLAAALSYKTMDVAGLVKPIPDIISGLTTAGSPHIPSYITNQTVLSITTIEGEQYVIKGGQLTSGRIYSATCNSNGTTKPQVIAVSQSVILSKVVIVTNCMVRFEKGVKLEDVVVATSNISPTAIDGGGEVVLGKNDNCASGGGAQLVTSGGITFASTLSIYGGQLLAAKDISIAAHANGIQGGSIVAGGKFTNNAVASWRTCPETSVENAYHGRIVAALVQ